jgi:hypothetical protein
MGDSFGLINVTAVVNCTAGRGGLSMNVTRTGGTEAALVAIL